MKKYATYKDIQGYVKNNYGFVPKTCWIADVMESCGLPVKKAQNRRGEQREYPCPEDKRSAIREALIHFGFLNESGSPIK